MELELGLKLARVADEFNSADFQISKDRSGPLFLSRETDTMFILTAHLRGSKFFALLFWFSFFNGFLVIFFG